MHHLTRMLQKPKSKNTERISLFARCYHWTSFLSFSLAFLKLWICVGISRWNERICPSVDRTRIEIFHDSVRSGAARVCSRWDHFWYNSSFLDLRYRHWRRCIIFPRDIPLYCVLGNQKVWNYIHSYLFSFRKMFRLDLLFFFFFFMWRYSWNWAHSFGLFLARRLDALKLILQVTFCTPPGQKWNLGGDSIRIQPIRWFKHSFLYRL